jgi:hypothetical protein
MWSVIAMANGIEDVDLLLDMLEDKMTPDHVAEAQRLASEWWDEWWEEHND